MRLPGRLFVIAAFAAIGYSFYWAQYESPRAQLGRAASDDCRRSANIVRVHVSVSKYPDNWRHIVDARAGRTTADDGITIVHSGLRWPSVHVKNNRGEDERRLAAFRLSGVTKTKPGMARDEYPPAVGRSTNGADVRYVPARPNGAQGASMGNQLRPYCNGQRFKLVAVR